MLGPVAADAEVERAVPPVGLVEGCLAGPPPAVGDRVADEQDADLAVGRLEVLEEAFVALEEAVVGVVGVTLDRGDVRRFLRRRRACGPCGRCGRLLLSLGGLGLLIELLNPGMFFPGVFGAISLILAFFVLGTLPVNWAGVALILLAFVLLAAEFLVAAFGALGIGGIVSLIAGGLLLTTSDNPDFEVSRWLVIGTGVFVGASRSHRRNRREPGADPRGCRAAAGRPSTRSTSRKRTRPG